MADIRTMIIGTKSGVRESYELSLIILSDNQAVPIKVGLGENKVLEYSGRNGLRQPALSRLAGPDVRDAGRITIAKGSKTHAIRLN
jgi:hypothetical protein